jgi:arabinose-5-phosphate isomerase
LKEILRHAREVIRIEAEAVQGLLDRLDENFARAVEALLSCKGRVVVTGIGKSGLVGRKIVSTLTSTGTPALFLHPVEGLHGDLGMVTGQDIVIAISNSGETTEIINLLPSLKKIGVQIIALTGGLASTLAKNSRIVVDAGVEREACPLGLAPTSSTTATLVIGDALAVALMRQRKFLARLIESFLGSDSMVIPEEASAGEAMRLMVEKNLLALPVLDGNGRVKGVVVLRDILNRADLRVF